MTKFVDAAPESRQGDWLLADDDSDVLFALQIDGDLMHLGWSVNATNITLPDAEEVGREVQGLIQRYMVDRYGDPRDAPT